MQQTSKEPTTQSVLNYLFKRRRELFLAKHRGEDVSFKNDYWPLIHACEIVTYIIEEDCK